LVGGVFASFRQCSGSDLWPHPEQQLVGKSQCMLSIHKQETPVSLVWHGNSIDTPLPIGSSATGLKLILGLVNTDSATIDLASIDCLNCGINIINLDYNKTKAARASVITIHNDERTLNVAKVLKQVYKFRIAEPGR
jgi:hypothetical protein